MTIVAYRSNERRFLKRRWWSLLTPTSTPGNLIGLTEALFKSPIKFNALNLNYSGQGRVKINYSETGCNSFREHLLIVARRRNVQNNPNERAKRGSTSHRADGKWSTSGHVGKHFAKNYLCGVIFWGWEGVERVDHFLTFCQSITQLYLEL